MSTSGKTYDMVIIGGGIHGAGIAQAGAAAGYSVLVIEKSALAPGTTTIGSYIDLIGRSDVIDCDRR